MRLAITYGEHNDSVMHPSQIAKRTHLLPFEIKQANLESSYITCPSALGDQSSPAPKKHELAWKEHLQMIFEHASRHRRHGKAASRRGWAGG